MKIKTITAAAIAALLLSGCLPKSEEPEDAADQEKEAQETRVIIPTHQLEEEYYRMLLPYKKSASYGLVVSMLNSQYNIAEVEGGLMRLSQQHFPTDEYYYQEGQYLDQETILSWLGGKDEENNPEGLNPAGQDQPRYVAHILEQNYLKRTSEDKIRLEGVSLAIALNTVNTITGDTIPAAQVEENGRAAAAEIVKRLRGIEGLKEVPIVVGLFRQSPKDDIVPGNYFAVGVAEKGKDVLSGWDPVNEEFVLFPTSSSEDRYRDVDTNFRNLKQDVEKYFSSFVNVIGTGFYKDGQIVSMDIDVPIEFYGNAEIIGFTQYLTGLLVDHLPDIHVEVSITSTKGPEALIVKKRGEAEPYTHIYHN